MSPRVYENAPYYEFETEHWPGPFSLSNVSTATDDAIAKHILSMDSTECDLYSEDGVWIVDFAIIRNQLEIWERLLPRVKIFYAVKTNPNPQLLKYLSNHPMKLGFDCASHTEIAEILSLSVSPDDIIYANPCKAPSHIRYASTKNVKKMTFDNVTELYKIKIHFPDAECILRFKVSEPTPSDNPSEGAMYELSKKYGVTIDYSREILLQAKKLGLNVTGLAFHVGSGQRNVKAFTHHIEEARRIWEIAREVGYTFTILDIGGGFMYSNFEKAANAVNTALDAEFGDIIERGEIEIVAEPGRYVSAPAFTLLTSVIAVREEKEEASEKRMVYLADGLYSNINAAFWLGELTFPTVVKGKRMYSSKSTLPTSSASSDSGIEVDERDEGDNGSIDQERGVATLMGGDLQEYSVWGPTCDCMDIVLQDVLLPKGIEVGDWFVFKDLGAYSTSMRTAFNGFRTSHKIYYINEGMTLV
ncbi:uncharacterized protein DFL_001607 [Arthrobotrys flagrans]|uniref:Orn/DAP/Arg decarboxylase 2 N-terminal domain-containing protein n=1 Tax=Arthrobotrys flagrans TaxID=97331 RepID=A0A437A8F9_ARTFL|nr:hypothetical protein DFL_001607 [Arthrobotrys flagrans]